MNITKKLYLKTFWNKYLSIYKITVSLMASLLYSFPRIYNFFLLLFHGKDLEKRYRIISRLIGRNKTVFELGSGTCLIAKYLDKSCKYFGWDLNPSFVSYNKKRGLDVKLKDIMDFKHYPKSDIILIIDVLHYITPNHEKLLDAIVKRAKHVIVVEPYNTTHLPKNVLLVKLLNFFNLVLGKNDGINNSSDTKWKYDKTELKEFFIKKGATRIIHLGSDLIVSIKK